MKTRYKKAEHTFMLSLHSVHLPHTSLDSDRVIAKQDKCTETFGPFFLHLFH